MPKLGESLAINLRTLREKKAFSQAHLGKLIGKSRQTIVNYENQLAGIDIKTISALAKALECDETDLTRDPKQKNIDEIVVSLTKVSTPKKQDKTEDADFRNRKELIDIVEQLKGPNLSRVANVARRALAAQQSGGKHSEHENKDQSS